MALVKRLCGDRAPFGTCPGAGLGSGHRRRGPIAPTSSLATLPALRAPGRRMNATEGSPAVLPALGALGLGVKVTRSSLGLLPGLRARNCQRGQGGSRADSGRSRCPTYARPGHSRRRSPCLGSRASASPVGGSRAQQRDSDAHAKAPQAQQRPDPERLPRHPQPTGPGGIPLGAASRRDRTPNVLNGSLASIRASRLGGSRIEARWGRLRLGCSLSGSSTQPPTTRPAHRSSPHGSLEPWRSAFVSCR